MSEEKSKLIPFTKELEEAIEADAKRCERSFVRQVVAVLKAYYEVDNVELKSDKLEIIGKLAPKSKRKIPTFEIDISDKKKKSA